MNEIYYVPMELVQLGLLKHWKETTVRKYDMSTSCRNSSMRKWRQLDRRGHSQQNLSHASMQKRGFPDFSVSVIFQELRSARVTRHKKSTLGAHQMAPPGQPCTSQDVPRPLLRDVSHPDLSRRCWVPVPSCCGSGTRSKSVFPGVP